MAFIYALTLAARNGLADLYARPAKNYLQDKRDEGTTLTETEWQAIHTNLLRALSLAPNDPVTLTELGRLHRILLEDDTLDRSEVQRFGESAIDYYEQAAMRRPTWPWGWSSVALVRYELFQDTESPYHQALIHAANFGPWEGQVQRLVTELGLDTWTTLGTDAKQAVLGTIDRALKRQPAGLEAIVDSDEAWQTICRAATPDAPISKTDELVRLQRRCKDIAID